ncbi:MAG: hypothetical protein WEA82_05480 [Idiomarina sp.]
MMQNYPNTKKLGVKVLCLFILFYVFSGLIMPFFGPSKEEFYSDVFQNSEDYNLYIMESTNFEKNKRSLPKEMIPILINCLKNEHRDLKNLGEHKSDKSVNLSLISEKYKYDLAFALRVDRGLAYIVGVERRTNLDNNNTTHMTALGMLGGRCFGKFLSGTL